MSAALALSVLLLMIGNSNAASWKPSKCRPGREEGNSISLEASCLPEGMEVRWTSASSEVEWVQVEYECRNLTTEDGQFQERSILLPVSRTTTGSDVIPLPPTRMECIISGCYEEGWFQRFAVGPLTYTCLQATQDDQISIYDEPQVEPDMELSVTTTLPLISSASLENMPLPTPTNPQSSTPAVAESAFHKITSSRSQSPSPSTDISTTKKATSGLSTVFTYTPTPTLLSTAPAMETTISRDGYAVSNAMSSPPPSPQVSLPMIPTSGAVESDFLVTASVALVFCLLASVVSLLCALILLRRCKVAAKHAVLTSSEMESGKEDGYRLVATSGVTPQDEKTNNIIS